MTQRFLDSLVGLPAREADVLSMKNGLKFSMYRGSGNDWADHFAKMALKSDLSHIKPQGRVCVEMDDEGIVTVAYAGDPSEVTNG